MPTLTLIYDYVPKRGTWKMHKLCNERGHAEPITYAQKRIERDDPMALLVALREAYPADRYTVVLQQRDYCTEEGHELRNAAFSFWSMDKKIAYLVCPCQRQRKVSYEVLLDAWGAKKMPQ